MSAVLSVEQLQRCDGGQWGPKVQQGMDVSQTGPVPAGGPGQHLREAAGVVPPAVQPLVPEQLVVSPLQPGGQKTDRGRQRGFKNRMGRAREQP